MKQTKQLSLFLANKPGVLSKVCFFLAKQKVNILGISVIDTHDHAVVRMIVDNPRVAVHCLGAEGILVLENDVLVLDLANRVGSLGAVSRTLAANKINIEYSYCTADKDQSRAQLVMSVSDLKRAAKLLKNY
jgi:hypothetical protein